MSTRLINRNGDNSPNQKPIRVAAIDIPVAPQAQPTGDTEGPTVPLHRNIRQQSSNNQDGHTVLIKNAATATNQANPLQPLNPEQWIHGWLVPICGPMKGRSFPILFGNNTAGRSSSSTICLPDDDKISRAQFSIRYIQSKNTYMVAPINTASQVTYLGDGEELIFPEPLNERDTLRLSPDTSVIFVPFCDTNYQWDYTDVPPAPEPAPQPAPQPMPKPVQQTTPRPAPQPATPPVPPFNLPPIPMGRNSSTVRINTTEIGLKHTPSARGQSTVRINTRAIGLQSESASAPQTTVRINRGNIANAPQTTNKSGDDEHTRLFRSPAAQNSVYNDPACHPSERWEQGWLVAISGPMKGMYFPITVGINQAGRSNTCRINLAGDPGISSVQFVIRYIKNKKQFFVSNVETASQFTYLNGEELTGYEPINKGDILRVSEQTSLRFIPLCNETFFWDYPENI